MREIVLAASIALGLCIAQGVVHLLASPSWLVVGLVAIGCGLIVSVPAAILYHLQLYRVLAPRGELDRGWIWHPTRLHVHLQATERWRVLGWFAVGVFGWTLAVAGCAVVAFAVYG